MNDKVLVAYATVAGATAEIAAEIADVIRKTGLDVDVKPASAVNDVTSYRAVILGTPIYMGQVQKEIAAFAERHHAALQGIPVHTFAVSGTVREGKSEAFDAVAAAMTPTNEAIGADSTRIFAGRIAYKRLSFLHRAIAKMMKVEEGDWRDWPAIRGWAAAVVTPEQVTA